MSDPKGTSKEDRSFDLSERFGGGLINMVLGALLVWIGQTTFEHSGRLASMNQRFESLQHQFDVIGERDQNTRDRIDKVNAQIADRTRARFTSEDGEKLDGKISQCHSTIDNVERRLLDRLTALQLKVIALEAQDMQEVVALRSEVERLRSAVSFYSGNSRGAAGQEATAFSATVNRLR